MLRPLGIAPGKAEGVVEQFGGLFRLLGEERLRLLMALDPEALADLALMTPNQRHIAPAALVDLQSIEVQADFVILTFQRC